VSIRPAGVNSVTAGDCGSISDSLQPGRLASVTRNVRGSPFWRPVPSPGPLLHVALATSNLSLRRSEPWGKYRSGKLSGTRDTRRITELIRRRVGRVSPLLFGQLLRLSRGGAIPSEAGGHRIHGRLALDALLTTRRLAAPVSQAIETLADSDLGPELGRGSSSGGRPSLSGRYCWSTSSPSKSCG